MNELTTSTDHLPVVETDPNLANLTALNHTDNPRALGGELLGNDGQGNQLWLFGDKVANRRVFENGDLLWSNDVEGWNYTEDDALDA